jgi:hypothetical protein
MRYLILLLILASCTAKEPVVDKSEPSVSVFNGAVSNMLGCIFAPQECEQLKQKQTDEKPHQTQKEYEQEITKELEELDKEAK